MTKTTKKLVLFLSVVLVCVGAVSGVLFVDLINRESIIYLFTAFILFVFGLFMRRQWLAYLLIWLAFAALVILIFTNPRFWLLLLTLAIGVFVLWRGILFHTEQRFHTIQLQIAEDKKEKQARVQKAYWLQERQMLANTYEWDDIHLMSWFGDTTIHLGNTILPEETNIIVIHKALGYVRIFVPIGVGISLSHNTISGNVLFENETYQLKNEQLSVYSENYTVASRRIKIVTTVYLGDIEVVRI